MMRRLLVPGSFPWLVHHDLRLNWRRFVDMFGGATPTRALLIALLGGLALHALAWPALPFLADFLQGPATTPDSRLAIGALLVCVASWMVAQGLFAATRTLYDRGDLDLLYGSPLGARGILAAKATAIALSSLGSVAVLALPVANVGALRLGSRWLAIYPALAGIALLATAVALAATIALFRVVGPSRARRWAHLAGALIGGGFVLGGQIVALLPDGIRHSVTDFFKPAPSGLASPLSGFLWLPVDAVLADPVAMLAVLATGAGAFALAAAGLGDSFARASLDAIGSPSESAVPSSTRRRIAFGRGASGALRHKEWRLLVRDPSLFAQLGLQIVYTIPLAVVLVRSGSLPIALAITPAIVVIAAQVAASLAWIAVSGEDAPELIASAPVAPRTVDAAKLSAIALPVLVIAGIPVAGLALASPWSALLALAFAAGASISTALLNLWHPMPGNRRGMLRRHAQSKVIGIVEHVLAILWAMAAVLALVGTSLWPWPLALAALVLGHDRVLALVRRPWRHLARVRGSA
ncbi:MAG: hypothetical protein AB7F78_01355 [Hyphomicrobiaceae bacterium]